MRPPADSAIIDRPCRDGDRVFGRGIIADSLGAVRYLEPGEWTVTALGSWKSPATGAVYPSGWRGEIPSEELSPGVQPAAWPGTTAAYSPGKGRWG